MSVAEMINVRELLLDSSSFGSAEVEQLEAAISNGQAAEVRQFLGELRDTVESGNSSDRNLAALGIGLFLMAEHAHAEHVLSQISGQGLADFYRARALIALDRFDEAAEIFDQAAKNGYDPIVCKLAIAGAVRLNGDIDGAEQILHENSREGATRADYSYQMGCILADRGDTFGAIEYFERAVDMDPHHSEALFRLAGQNNLMGNDGDAIKLYERSLSKPPLYLGALINLGLLYEDNEQYSAAAFCFRRVLDVNPNHKRAELYLKDIEASSDMYYDEEAVRRNREIEQVLKIPITDFELSARSRNCLERAEIATLGDLTRKTEQELLAGKNFGDTSLREIREILAARGLRIGQYANQEPMAAPVIDREDLSPQERALLDSPVTDLDLSVRARKCLARLGITMIGELVSKSADDLLSVRNFGVTSLNEIRNKLTDANLSLRNE